MAKKFKNIIEDKEFKKGMILMDECIIDLKLKSSTEIEKVKLVAKKNIEHSKNIGFMALGITLVINIYNLFIESLFSHLLTNSLIAFKIENEQFFQSGIDFMMAMLIVAIVVFILTVYINKYYRSYQNNLALLYAAEYVLQQRKHG